MPVMTSPEVDPTTVPPTDDITDPTVPLQTIADLTRERAEEAEKALAPDTETLHLGTFEGRALLNVDQACYKISEHAATCLNMISNSWDAAVKVLNQNNSAFLCLKEALQSWAPHTPYSATIHVVTPSGFQMTLTVEALNQDEFLGKVGALMGFLKEGGFTPQVRNGS